MAYEFDIKVVVKRIIKKILKSAVPPVLYIDSKFLYYCLVKLDII